MNNYQLNQSSPERNFYKRNYVDVLDILTPKVYLNEDLAFSGVQQSVNDLIIKSHISLAKNINSIFNISGVSTGALFSSLSGTSQFFVKQNGLTNVTTQEFLKNILDPLGKTYTDFKNETEFRSFVESTLIPNIRLNSPNYLFGESSVSGAHGYLLDTLSWMYILNTSANGGLSYQPSAIVANRLVSTIYYGKPITLNLALKDVTEYIWKNYSVCSVFSQYGLIPSMFLSGTGKHTSGTQQLDKLHTLIDVLYSPLYSDSTDTRIREAFDLQISLGTFDVGTERAGSFSRFLKAIAYSMYDVNDKINNLNLLYDIDRCPEEYLPRIADLISWDLVGNNPEKWRVQLKNAINIYKSKGTKRGLNLVLESTFGQTSFDLSSQITELYESYLPNLLYYCLATESNVLSSFGSWTFAKAQSLAIQNYSPDSMDTNIRFVVDSILKGAFDLYPQNFFIGNRPFGLFDTYSYRGVINTIPPWELEKYYRYCKLDRRILNYFLDRLACFGVPEYVRDNLESFILSNTLDATSDLSVYNSWLIFSPSVVYPPNRDDILKNFKKEKVKYLPLWNGKSSSFFVSLESSSFDFDKYSNEILSSEGLKGIFRSILEYTPAHAIPLNQIKLSASDVADYTEYSCPEVNYNASADFFVGSSVMSGYSRFGVNMSSLSRIFGRTSVDTLSDFSSVAISNLDRTSVRRRNFKNLIPKSGWYDRTGFNMPGYLAPSTYQNYNTYLPLGYIPSANKFTPITSYETWVLSGVSSIEIPDVYGKCEDLRSINSYNGVYTSATFRTRGGSSLDDSACIRYATRSDCDPIIPLIFNKLLAKEVQKKQELLEVSGMYELYELSPLIYNVEQSLANAELSALPNSKNDFYNFEFGRGIHKIYSHLINSFGYHDLSRDSVRDDGGFNIFAHTYGTAVFNGNLNVEGSAAVAYPILTTSYDNEILIDNNFGSGILSLSGVTSGTYVASTTADLYVDTYEFRNPHIVSGVELISPSGTSISNYFSVFKIDTSFETEDLEDFAIDNTLIKINTKSNTKGLHRIKFDLGSYGPTPSRLLPDSQYELQIPYFVGRKSGTKKGGGSIRVWIHTEPENGYVWSWNKDNKWRLYSLADLTPAYILENLVFEDTQPLVDLQTIGACGQLNTANLSLRNLRSADFTTLSIKFDTLNRIICMPNYYANQTQVHRLNQNYSIEIFAAPDSTDDTYLLIDKLNLYNTELLEYSDNYSEEELQKVLLFFRTMALENASRVSTVTSGLFGASGGSRLEYRYHPKFGTHTMGSYDNYTVIGVDR